MPPKKNNRKQKQQQQQNKKTPESNGKSLTVSATSEEGNNVILDNSQDSTGTSPEESSSPQVEETNDKLESNELSGSTGINEEEKSEHVNFIPITVSVDQNPILKINDSMTSSVSDMISTNQQNGVMKDLLEFLNYYKSTNRVSDDHQEHNDWKSLYFAVSKQLNLERSKTETLEKLVLEKDKENQTLKDQIRLMELELVTERKKLNKTVGTIRNAKKLTIRLGSNVDVSTIIDELNAGVDKTMSEPNAIEGLANIISSAGNTDQLINRLNNLKTSVSNGSSLNLLSTSSSDKYSESDVKSIIKVQSLVRKWLAKKVYKKLKIKRSIIEELFETERTYVSRLKDLLNIFVNPLKHKVKHDPILENDQIDSIFSNVNMIYKSNTIFLDRIEEIYLKYNKWSCFGDKILEQLPLFECYIDYIINFEFASSTLKKLQQTSKSLNEFIKAGESKPELDDLDLNDLLIMPVQRIPRYIMLLKEIRKATPIYHNDFKPIDSALEAFKHFALSINEKSGARKKVLLLEDRILGYKDDLTSNYRYLVREGHLKFKKSNEYVFLFSDMILVCHPTLKKVKSKTLSAGTGASTANHERSSSSTSPLASPNLNSSRSSTQSSSENLTSSSQNPEVETFFKFISRINLDARVKIVQDQQEPKFSVIIPDDSLRIEFVASSFEERLLWVQDIMMIVSNFVNHIINNQSINQNSTDKN